ncbi:MAG: cytochrome P450 [Pseudonocardiaceae bacterium]|jgi:cytochrome P450|nr:cytochrome P450 [Pseudonocardiaceae bacterium]
MVVGLDVASHGSRSARGIAPVVPGRLPLLGHTMSLLDSPFRFLSSLRSHGEVVRIYLGTLPVYLVTSPELAWQVFATDADRFDKGMIFDRIRPLSGNGLLNSDGDFNRRQRRLIQPAFHRKRIANYVDIMARAASDLVESWRPGEVVAVDQRMENLALSIVGQTLFATELGRDAITEAQRSMPILSKYLAVRAFVPKLMERLPIPANRRYDEAAARFRRVVAEVIVAARAEGKDHDDLLSTLLLARDEDTGEGMSDQQVHDEVVTILTAGAETTAVALSWFFYELGCHPEVQRRFHAEIDHLLAGRIATFDDIPKLEYTQRIIREVLRKYPLLLLMRRARIDVDLGGVHIAPGTEVALSQYALHHDPHLYPEPARFDPDRWLPDRASMLPKGAFVPFGAGLHHCPGYSYAEAEIAIVAATVAARWQLVPVTGKPVHPRLTATMHPPRLSMIATPRHI